MLNKAYQREIKKSYNKISKIIKKIELAQNVEFEILPVIYWISESVLKQNDLTEEYLRENFIKFLTLLYNKSESVEKLKKIEERRSIYQSVLDGQIYWRGEWLLGAKTFNNNILTVCMIVLGDILINPECGDNYMEAPQKSYDSMDLMKMMNPMLEFEKELLKLYYNINKIFKNDVKKAGMKKYLLYSIVLVMVILVLFFYLNKKSTIEELKDSAVMIITYDENGIKKSTGSGFCAFSNNTIITNYHVIDGAVEIIIKTDDKKEYKVDTVDFNVKKDLAFLYGDFNLKPLKIAKNINIKAGDDVVVIGCPKGELNTVSTGVISNADNYDIRITAPISPGSSGGALLNKNHEVIGIVYATYNSLESQNLNYAISAEKLKKENDKRKSVYPWDMGTINGIYSNKLSWVDEETWYSCSMDEYDDFNNLNVIFEKSIFNVAWHNIYKTFTREEKEALIRELKIYNDEIELYHSEFGFGDLHEVGEWSDALFFINLLILEKNEYCIMVTDLSRCKTLNEQINKINSYDIEAPKKSIIKYLVLGQELTRVERTELFEYIKSRKYNPNDESQLWERFNRIQDEYEMSAVLIKLGYKVTIDNGNVYAEW